MADTESPACVGKKCSFDEAFKLKVVAFTESTTGAASCSQVFVDGKSVQKWRKQKDSLLALPNKKNRIHRGG